MENLVIELLPADYEAIAELWEASVRATHHFLKPKEIGFYKPYLLKYALPACRLYGIKTNEGKLCAFIGLSDDKIEMLFVNPKFFKNGCGRRLVDFAEQEKNIKKVVLLSCFCFDCVYIEKDNHICEKAETKKVHYGRLRRLKLCLRIC